MTTASLFDLTGKRAVVTGTSAGIGTRLARTLVLAGAAPLPVVAAVSIGNITHATGGKIFSHNNNGNLLIVIGTRRSRLDSNITGATYNGVRLAAVPKFGP